MFLFSHILTTGLIYLRKGRINTKKWKNQTYKLYPNTQMSNIIHRFYCCKVEEEKGRNVLESYPQDDETFYEIFHNDDTHTLIVGKTAWIN